MLETRSELLKRAAYSRQIRAHLGDGLGAYYAATQKLPLPDRLADLIEQLARRLDEVRCKPESSERPISPRLLET
jgi:hypothetical protein